MFDDLLPSTKRRKRDDPTLLMIYEVHLLRLLLLPLYSGDTDLTCEQHTSMG